MMKKDFIYYTNKDGSTAYACAGCPKHPSAYAYSHTSSYPLYQHVVDQEILGKPVDAADARRMLRLISGREHQVITGVCLTTTEKIHSFSVSTDVAFKQLSENEIDYYIEHYKPFDKAGAYGIQEWIGYIGVTSLHGSYFNVMGLPVQRIYAELQKF